jgi:hypothetical protein
MVAAMVMVGPRADLTSALRRPMFAGSLAALLLTLVSGAAAAFALSVPGAGQSPWHRALPLLTGAAWASIWLVVLWAVELPAGPGTAAFHSACALEIVGCAVAAGWLLFVMLARAAPLRPLWTAAVASLASMATGAGLAQVLCPIDDPWHQLIGHVVVAVLVAGAGLLVGRRAFNTRRSAR